ncbi:unnamed protein product [Calypogeia fissa]
MLVADSVAAVSRAVWRKESVQLVSAAKGLLSKPNSIAVLAVHSLIRTEVYHCVVAGGLLRFHPKILIRV